MYSSYPALIHAFHGCDHELAEAIFAGHETLKPSQNSYDWLGHGIYFWENDHVRAYQYAVNLSHNPKSKVKFPAVVGATIDLGYCFNLLEADALAQLKAGYEVFSELQQVNGLPMPKNKTVENGEDLLLRPRLSRNRNGQYFVNFSPAIAPKSKKAIFEKIRQWRLHKRSDLSIKELANWINPVVRGWIGYYGTFFQSELLFLVRHLDKLLYRWVIRKYKKQGSNFKKTDKWVKRIKREIPDLFVHWSLLRA